MIHLGKLTDLNILNLQHRIQTITETSTPQNPAFLAISILAYEAHTIGCQYKL